MRLFYKTCAQMSMTLPEVKVYYPVINIHTQALQYYDSYTVIPSKWNNNIQMKKNKGSISTAED